MPKKPPKVMPNNRKHALPRDPMAKPEPYPKVGPAPEFASSFRHTDPKVADHIARMVFKHSMNYSAAIAEMLPAKTRESTIAEEVYALRRSPWVQAALTKIYKMAQIDDATLKKYIEVLWERFMDGSEKQQAYAARHLAAALGISEKADESAKPQELKIKGLDEGLARMGLLDAPAKSNPTGFGTIEEEDAED